MLRSTKSPTLPEAGAAFLAEALDAVADASIHAHRRRAGRLALSFRVCRRDRDDLPVGPAPLDSIHLFALSHGWTLGAAGGVHRRVVLAIYKPAIDLPGTGRIAFRCEVAWPVGRRAGFASPDPRTNPTAARAAVLLAQAVADAGPRDLAERPVLPHFYSGFRPERPPAFEPTVCPEVPPAQEPARLGSPGDGTHAVFADLGHLQGRRLRNPAWRVLADRGLIPDTRSYRAWLDTVRDPSRSGRDRFQDPLDDATEAGRIRRALEKYAEADPGHLPALFRDLGAACLALGVPVPRDTAAAEDLFIDLLDRPWAPAEIPGAARIQVVRLAGPPDPTTAIFSDATTTVDLSDLGDRRDRFEPAPDRLVRELLRQGGRMDRRREPASRP